MIGRNKKDELYISGARHNKLFQVSIIPLLYTAKIHLLAGHDGGDNQEDWTYSSDHGSFYEKGIPYLYFGVEDHNDYHKTTDEFENIQQEFYLETTRVIIQAIQKVDELM